MAKIYLLSNGQDFHQYLNSEIVRVETELIDTEVDSKEHKKLYTNLEFLRIIDSLGVRRN